MRVVVQRVSAARVTMGAKDKAVIGPGLLVFVAVEEPDNQEDVTWISGKLVRLRVFDDGLGVMNRSIVEAGGDILLVSQFTLFASTRKGNRPSYSRSASPQIAIPLYEALIAQLGRDLDRPIHTGEFGADMQVSLTNDGPVTIIIDSRTRE